MIRLPIPRRQRGDAAEALALRHLQRQGLKLVERNWRCAGGELDLIMRDGDALVLVEVRARSRGDYGGAAASVGPRKRARLIHAAGLYLASHPAAARLAVRFDVLAIEADGVPNWIRNAFDTDG